MGSQLASVALTTDLLQARADLREAERAELANIGAVVRSATETLRDIVWVVDPEHDAPEALLWKMKNEAATLLGEIEYRFEHPAAAQLGEIEALDMRARRHLVLIFKEALHNIVAHAQAGTVQIALRLARNQLSLIIHDDGVGFRQRSSSQAGYGIKNMRRRARQMGGTLDLKTESGGTMLRLTVPLS